MLRDIIQQIDNVKINKFADLSGYLNNKTDIDILWFPEIKKMIKKENKK